MKQVIIRIQNEKGRTLQRFYYTSYAQYQYYACDDVQKALKKGLTAYIKVGNEFCRFIEFEECEETLKEYPEDFKSINDVIYNKVIDNYDVNYYIKDYLPRY